MHVDGSGLAILWLAQEIAFRSVSVRPAFRSGFIDNWSAAPAGLDHGWIVVHRRLAKHPAANSAAEQTEPACWRQGRACLVVSYCTSLARPASAHSLGHFAPHENIRQHSRILGVLHSGNRPWHVVRLRALAQRQDREGSKQLSSRGCHRRSYLRLRRHSCRQIFSTSDIQTICSER